MLSSLTDLIALHSFRLSDRVCLKLGVGVVPWDFVFFIDISDMEKFSPFIGQLNEGYRFHNWRKPAITLSFGTKHKYATRELKGKEVLEQFELLRKKLLKKEGKELDPGLVQQQLLRLEQVLLQPEKYEVLSSSYYKYYSYPTISYKYIAFSDQHPLGKYISVNSTVAITKKNIVFVDREHLNNKKHLYSSKKIEKKLLSYEKVYDAGSIDYFVRVRKKPPESGT